MTRRTIFLLVILFFSLMTLYANEIQFWGHYLERKQFLLFSALAGLIVGLLVSWRFSRTLNPDWLIRIRSSLAITFGTVVLFPLLVSLTNRALPQSGPRTTEVEFVREEGRFTSRFGSAVAPKKPSTYFLFFNHDSQFFRVQYQRSHFPDQQEGDTIALPLRKGLWGFEWVDLQ